MISKRIEHPLRTIEVTYNELKPFHPFEEEMLERYTTLHNFVKELYEEYTDVQTKYEMHDRNIRQVIARFRAIKGRMNNLTQSAKRILNVMIPDKAEADRIIADAMEFKQLINSFDKDINALANESDSLSRIFTPLDSKDERLSEIFAEYKAFREDMCDSNEYSIDINQYNNDEQQFMGSLTDMTSKQDQFIGVCNQVIDRYNLLIEEVENTYEQWGQYNEMIEMVKLLAVTPHDIRMICLN
ncbi:MAG: hypothetical protein JWO06_1485 [Bacteroidota bacterium]|nr:hypothetical protein [Bacteroidota bacterium]